MNDAGVLGCLKHFQVMEILTSIRIWDYQYWKKFRAIIRNELVPFIKGIEHHVDSINDRSLGRSNLNNGQNTRATLSKTNTNAFAKSIEVLMD
jgi:hypothetical protein